MPVEVASVGAIVEDFHEQIRSFLLRTATDNEGLESLVRHQRQVQNNLVDDFAGYSELISEYPVYGASAFVGLVKFEQDVDELFESIMNDGSLLMDCSISEIRQFIKVEKGVAGLARQIIDLDERIFMLISLMLWSAHKQIPALQKLGEKEEEVWKH